VQKIITCSTHHPAGLYDITSQVAEIIKGIQKKDIHLLDEVIFLTGAGTGCGRCHPQIKKILEH